jgi:hypothetical protein
MTLFEYLAIAYGLLLSLSAVRLLNGLSNVLHSARRYWTHALWVCVLLLAALLMFWQHWSTLNVEWTFLTFVMNLAGPGMIYFLARPRPTAKVERNAYVIVNVEGVERIASVTRQLKQNVLRILRVVC